MFVNATRFMGVCLALSAVTSVHPAWRRGEWSVVLDSIALTLVAVVLWFAVERGSDQLRPPRFGTRPLRLALYATILMLCVVSGLGRQLAPDTWGCASVTTALLAAVILTPFIRSELRRREHEALS